jgi:SAM-dependent methyltransferase
VAEAPRRANQAEWRRWNDQRWTKSWPDREQLTGVVTPVLLGAASLIPGQSVLDVGSGGGASAFASAQEVGRTGRVVAVDLSDALIQLARKRGADLGLDNLTFVQADAQSARLDPEPFDTIVSQFGLMFFEDPVVAFSNLREHLRPGGRLVFACWQEADRNPWHTRRVLQRFLQPPAVPVGTTPPGAFSLGDWGRCSELLDAAGFGDTVRRDHEMIVEAPPDAVFDPGQLGFLGVRPEDQPAALEAVEEHLDSFRINDGRCRYPLAFRIVVADRG